MAPVKELRLSVLYGPEEGVPNVDLVLVHGFGGDLIDTWTWKQPGPEVSVCWPQQLLPPKMPQTRVLSFGYDAGNTTMATIRDNARTLLAYLSSQRDGDSRGWPVVFLAHCLGGLIVKQAMCFATKERRYKPVALATRSIMFFGTPHGGGEKRGWLELAKGYEGFGPKCKMIDVLAKNTDDLTEIDEDFCRLTPSHTIVNFIEQQPMPGRKKPIVTKMSAAMVEDGKKEFLGVNADHIGMCQFKDADDSTFVEVCRVIKEAVIEASGQETAALGRASAVVPSSSAQRPQRVTQARLPRGMIDLQSLGGLMEQPNNSATGRLLDAGTDDPVEEPPASFMAIFVNMVAGLYEGRAESRGATW